MVSLTFFPAPLARWGAPVTSSELETLNFLLYVQEACWNIYLHLSILVTTWEITTCMEVMLSYLSYDAAVALMSVDLGSEWMKVAVVSVSSLPSQDHISHSQGC